MNDPASNEKILFFFGEKLSLLKKYLSISRKIIEHLIADKEGHLSLLISDRQGCINRIQGIDKLIAGRLSIGGKKLDSFSDKIIGLADGYRNDFKDILKSIESADQEIMQRVKAESFIIRDDLLKFQKTRHAARTYGAVNLKRPRYLDTLK